MKYFISIILLLVLSFFYACQSTQKTNTSQEYSYTISIDYGKEQPYITNVKTSHALTAMEALQYAATVKTNPVGQFVFVKCINNTCNKRGDKAWYYEINGKPADKLAINYNLKTGDTLQFIYKTDVCSGKVDKQ